MVDFWTFRHLAGGHLGASCFRVVGLAGEQIGVPERSSAAGLPHHRAGNPGGPQRLLRDGDDALAVGRMAITSAIIGS